MALESQEAARADRLAVSSSITVASRAMRAAMSVAFLAWVASNRHGAAAAGDLRGRPTIEVARFVSMELLGIP
ncbi:hypothetical protein BKG83_18390 [Mycobacteroides chelonae]|uniref:Uncharacterized protein n=1 Tax=Mycobacteroides chelonae TaxID=1774 RepID=A0A1S1LYK4_MYCCH|nr:hypothetical protein BKG83_18390 [Mycobacteroides chelonae]OHU75718.1 hypothetical protein BKG84_27345 [Mycobacteroides chelonae]